MAKQKVLITVTTYPLPSRSYDELVCTAGVLEDGSWIRIYPVPLSFLKGLRESGEMKTYKYTWIEIDLKKRTDDFRPESHSPAKYDFSDIVIGKTLPPAKNWAARKEYCLADVYTNMGQLITDSQKPENKSLATFKPTEILDFIVEDDDRDWKPLWKEIRKQQDLFSPTESGEPKDMIPKVPYKFKYRFKDDSGKESHMMIEDWETGALYWNCLRAAEGDEEVALQKVRQRYFDDFVNNKDLYLFLGTTAEGHRRRWSNPFVIIGVFYPKKETQYKLEL